MSKQWINTFSRPGDAAFAAAGGWDKLEPTPPEATVPTVGRNQRCCSLLPAKNDNRFGEGALTDGRANQGLGGATSSSAARRVKAHEPTANPIASIERRGRARKNERPVKQAVF